MSKKRKRSGGNPAHRAHREGTLLGKAILQWSERILSAGDDDQATLAAALIGWVGSGDPGRLGLNQCVSACYQLQMVLEAVGVESRMVPVSLTVLDKVSQRELAVVGSDTPSWSDGVSRWSGHAVLYLPRQGRVLDPTIGQAFPTATLDERMPLIGRVSAVLHGTSEQATQTGTVWAVARHTHIASYRVLDPAYDPMMNPDVVNGLRSATSRLRKLLPQMVQLIDDMIQSRKNLTADTSKH
ncbi:hypothetical protein [Plantibacter sp. RU18]|uniref:hypothetical protein n=1 Tax=Plantibacter sp. RU18 TaxID=3158143 RepID=UPI003D35F5AA